MYGQTAPLIDISTQTDDYVYNNTDPHHVTNITKTLHELQPVGIVDHGHENTTVEKIALESLNNKADPHHFTNITEILPQPQPVAIVDDEDENTTVEKIDYQSLNNNADPHHVVKYTETLPQPKPVGIVDDEHENTTVKKIGYESLNNNVDPHYVTNITETLPEPQPGVVVKNACDLEGNEQCLHMDVISYCLQTLQDSLNEDDDKQQQNTAAVDLFSTPSTTETENGPPQQYDLSCTNEGILDNFASANSNSRQMQESAVRTACKEIENSLTCPSFQTEQQRNPLADSCGEKQMKEKRFECTCCKETFKQKKPFFLHLTTHAFTNHYFECLYCEQNFHEKCDLVVHLGTHAETQKDNHLITTTQSTDPAITYVIQESKNPRCKKPKLIDSMGNTYSMIKKRLSETEWQCTIRCNASVLQKDDMFLLGPAQHSHGIRRPRHANINNEKQDNAPTEKADCTSMSRDTYSNDVSNITEILPQAQPAIAFEPELILNLLQDPEKQNTSDEILDCTTMNSSTHPHLLNNITETTPEPQPVGIVYHGQEAENTTVENITYESINNNADPHHVTNTPLSLLQPQPGVVVNEGSDLGTDELSLNMHNISLYLQAIQDSLNEDDGKQITDAVDLFSLPTISECENEFPQQYDLVFKNQDLLNNFAPANFDSRHMQEREFPISCQEMESSLTYPSFPIELQRNPVADPHLGKQINEKPFECTVCKETFKHRETFLLHLTTHAFKKKYIECLYCEQNFRQKSDLVVHFGTHAELQKDNHFIATTQSEPTVTCSIEEADNHTRKRPKLIDSMGFVYSLHSKRRRGNYWQCSVRCKAFVLQIGNRFFPGPAQHSHSIRRPRHIRSSHEMQDNEPTEKIDCSSKNSDTCSNDVSNITEILPQPQPATTFESIQVTEKHNSLAETSNCTTISSSTDPHLDTNITETIQPSQPCATPENIRDQGIQFSDIPENSDEQPPNMDIANIYQAESHEMQVGSADEAVASIFPVITYTVHEEGTINMKPKLIDSNGYTYTIQRKRQTATDWVCTSKSRRRDCRAMVIQKGNRFSAGPTKHIHSAPDRPFRNKNKSIKERTKDNTEIRKHKTSKKMDKRVRFGKFKLRVFRKYNEKAEVINERTIRCLYEKDCKKEILCLQYSMQNFDTHVQFHKNKEKTVSNSGTDKDVEVVISNTRQSTKEHERVRQERMHNEKARSASDVESPSKCQKMSSSIENSPVSSPTDTATTKNMTADYCEPTTNDEESNEVANFSTSEILPLSLDGGNTSNCSPEYQGYTKKPCATSTSCENKECTCILCSKLFTNVKEYDEHLRTHCDAKGAVCPVCNKKISSRVYLMAHLHIHSGYRPYHCTYCHKGFQVKNTLAAHERIHTNEKPYACKYCKKSFKQQNGLQQHERIHTGEKPYTCKYCKKSFTQQIGLQTHERIHTGEKPFICKYCKKSFAAQNVLKQHERIHTGEKPFTCIYCKKSFRQRNRLIYHQHIH